MSCLTSQVGTGSRLHALDGESLTNRTTSATDSCENSSRPRPWKAEYSGLAAPAVEDRTSPTLSLKNFEKASADRSD